MPSGGHNRLPDHVAAQRGTDRREPKPRDPPPPPGKVPAPPAAFKGPLRRVWRELASQVEEVGSYTTASRSGFGLMVRAVAAVEEAPADCAPTAYAQLQRAAAGWLERFGLTPGTRAKVQAETSARNGDRFSAGASSAAGPDAVESFLFGKQLRVVKGGRRG